MEFSKYDLKQITEEYLKSLSREDLLRVSIKLTQDLKESVDRLNQNSQNSSRPSSSMTPWEQSEDAPEAKEGELSDSNLKENQDQSSEKESGSESEKSKNSEQASKPESDAEAPKNKPPGKKRLVGKQKGAPGFGKSWHPKVTESACHHSPKQCACCEGILDISNSTAYTSYNQIEIQLGTEDRPGLFVTVTPHVLYETQCACGHSTRYEPKASPMTSEEWSDMALSEWRSVGPNLAAFIGHLKMEFRHSIGKIQGILSYFGIHLSTGTLQYYYTECGAAVSELEEPLRQALLEEVLLHADETTWLEKAHLLWLWVFKTATVVYFCVGKRTKNLLQQVLTLSFTGWLMTDGYGAYRHYEKRLRCWSHLLRKARGLMESAEAVASEFGALAYSTLVTLMESIYTWREQGHPEEKTEALMNQHQALFKSFKQTCEKFGDKAVTHKKTKELAREFLNDWDAIFKVLEHPYLPLTNNEAERALRPWVLIRKICYGSRTPRGTKTFTLLASVMATCRQRGVNSMNYLSQAIASARTGQLITKIPQVTEGN